MEPIDNDTILARTDATLAFEGLQASPEATAITKRYLAGELTREEAGAAILALYHPAP